MHTAAITKVQQTETPRWTSIFMTLMGKVQVMVAKTIHRNAENQFYGNTNQVINCSINQQINHISE
jgi:hypothetical protein